MRWNDSGAFICGGSVWSIPLTCPRLPVTPACLDEVNTSFYRAADWQSLMAGFGRYKKLVQLNWLTVCGIPFVLVMMVAGWGRTWGNGFIFIVDSQCPYSTEKDLEPAVNLGWVVMKGSSNAPFSCGRNCSAPCWDLPAATESLEQGNYGVLPLLTRSDKGRDPGLQSSSGRMREN